MSDEIKRPAPAPCGSCPYRLDTPAGVWDAEEYEKLPEFDGETWEQPPAVFLCHQQTGRVCAGWAACHDMHENMGVRLAAASGRMTPETVTAVLDYATDVALHPTGAAACAFGMGEIETPSPKAIALVEKLQRKQVRFAQKAKDGTERGGKRPQ